MFETILNYYTELICTALVAVIAAGVRYLKNTIKNGTELMLATAHDDLYRFAEFYISTNEITLAELKNLEHIYNGYHALGGNGTGTELFERCKDLPIVDVRTKYNPYYLEKDKETGGKNGR